MVVFTIPHAKPPNEEIGAIELGQMIKDAVGDNHVFLHGEDHKEIVNVETVMGKDTEYVHDFYMALKQHPIHVDLRSYDAEDEVLSALDVALAYLPGLTNMGMVDALFNSLNDICEVEKIEAEYSTHRLSVASEALFDTPSIIIYVNEGAVDLYSAVSEAVVLYLAERPVVQKIE